MTEDTTLSPVIWCITDGKAGHEKQSQGLCKAISQLLKTRVFFIPAESLFKAFFYLASGRFPAGKALPKPDLVLCTGSQTHITALAARRSTATATIVLMDPGIFRSCFDLCIIPKHDSPPKQDNIFITQGAITNQSPVATVNQNTGLILLGGPSRHYQWDANDMLNQIGQIISNGQEINWTLCDSRRTPVEMLSELRNLAEEHQADFVHYADCDQDWLAKQLQLVEYVWVTEDSVSMIYEAITAGRKTGLLSVPVKNKNKLSNALNDLLQQNYLTTFNDWKAGKLLSAPAQEIDEAKRVALFIKQRFLHD